MKPVEHIPGLKFNNPGETTEKRLKEIRDFLLANCRYAEIEMFTKSEAEGNKKAYVDKASYDKILKKNPKFADVRCLAREGKVYLERVNFDESWEDGSDNCLKSQQQVSSEYGALQEARYNAICRFVSSNEPISEVPIFTPTNPNDTQKRAFVEKTGYDNVMNLYNVNNVKTKARNGKLYLERTDMKEGEES